jgi:Tol biopolymer transport system component
VAPGPGSDIVFTTNSYTTAAGSPRELFAIEASGAGLARLTFCNVDPRRCDSSEAAPAPDRERMAVLRVSEDVDGDGRLTAADGQALLVADLVRAVEGRLVAQSARVSGVDWSRGGDVLVYSAGAEGALEDLFRVDPSGQDNRNLTVTPNVRERRPRLDPAATVAVYERIEADGKGQVFIFAGQLSQIRVTSGGPGSAPLAGTPYVVGSDADPAFSPDGRSIVFRRLTGTGNGGLGTWDVLTVRNDGSGLAVVASGPVFRGAPDWGTQGIVFVEAEAAGTAQLVVTQADGTGRRSILTVPAALDISNPRWLP